VGLTVSLLYAGLCGLILIGLSWRVVGLRRRFQVGIGTGNQPPLELAIRAHANFTEYTPLGLVLLIALDGSGAVNTLLLHGLGISLVVGRLLHGFFGLNRSAGTTSGRLIGTLLTWLMLLISAALAIWVAVGRMLLS